MRLDVELLSVEPGPWPPAALVLARAGLQRARGALQSEGFPYKLPSPRQGKVT